jgi:heme-degrading monooxygenase HmoA
MGDVVFINCFEVPAGREQAFMELWSQIDAYMLGKPGFRWRRLHRAISDDTRLRYVNVAGWASAGEFDAAHDDNFRRMQAQAGWAEFPALPALYTVEDEVRG